MFLCFWQIFLKNNGVKLMKKIILLLIFVLLAGNVNALNNIVITEVLYDPINSETGGEAVQIYNPTSSQIDISGWILSTETSAADATIPAGTMLLPKSYYLIADSGWATLKDNVSWPDANHEEAITLANLDAGVALMNRSFVIDAVGWGNSAGISLGLFEGTPANLTAQGKSLRRKFDIEYTDANNNIDDFYSSTPLFSSPQIRQDSNMLTVYAVVEGAVPVIDTLFIADEDPTIGGIQIMPSPKSAKQFLITAQVTDTDESDIDKVYAELNSITYYLNKTTINSTTALYYGYLEMPFYSVPGNYTVSITALDYSNLMAIKNLTFEYLSLVGIEMDSNSIIFNALPGKVSELVGDADFSTANLTMRNIGNTVIDVKISGTDLSNGASIINASSIKYTFMAKDYSSALSGTLSYSPELKDLNLNPGENSLKGLSFRLNVPTTAAPGNYTGSISITSVAS